MSSISLKTASGGSVILAPENTAADVTLTVPAGTSDLVSTDTLRTELNATGSAPIYACRAWVNFNGSASVLTIRASGNVSSVVRNSTGQYTINFTTAMPDSSYICNVSGGNGTPGNNDSFGFVRVYQGTTTSQRIGIVTTDNLLFENRERVYVSFFR